MYVKDKQGGDCIPPFYLLQCLIPFLGPCGIHQHCEALEVCRNHVINAISAN